MALYPARGAEQNAPRVPEALGGAALIALVCATALAGCGGDDGQDRSKGGSINVAIVDAPNPQDLAHLTPSLFTREEPHQGELHDPRRGHPA